MDTSNLTPSDLVHRLIDLSEQNGIKITLLGVCPISPAITEAAVQVAARNNMPMLFPATLNQVDRDGGYTGWTPADLVELLQTLGEKYDWDGPLYPCLDHGGPWLKDVHTLNGLSFDETMGELKQTLSACVEAGYALLHIDPTADRTLPTGTPVPIELVIERTVELIKHAETERKRLGLGSLSYEVGTEEVAGGLVDLGNFRSFLRGLRAGLEAEGLADVWPCFIVGKVGTDIDTSWFDPASARELHDIVRPLGSLVKGHYSDWVSNPEDYPATGMGGANFGPELTSVEYLALRDLCSREIDLCRARPSLEPSGFLATLEEAVIDSGRWKKWLNEQEKSEDFESLEQTRKDFLIESSTRYVWTVPAVVEARAKLYGNLNLAMSDPNGYIVERIAMVLEKYVTSMHLFDSLTYFQVDGLTD